MKYFLRIIFILLSLTSYSLSKSERPRWNWAADELTLSWSESSLTKTTLLLELSLTNIGMSGFRGEGGGREKGGGEEGRGGEVGEDDEEEDEEEKVEGKLVGLLLDPAF